MSNSFGDLQKIRNDLFEKVGNLKGNTMQDKINSMSLTDFANFQKNIYTLTNDSNNLTGYSATMYPYMPTDIKQLGTYSFNNREDLMTQIGGLHTAESCMFSAVNQKTKNMNIVKPDTTPNTYHLTYYDGEYEGNMNKLKGLQERSSSNTQIDPNTGLPTTTINTSNTPITVVIQGFFKVDSAGAYIFDYKPLNGISNPYGWIGENAISMYKTENAFMTPTNNQTKTIFTPNTYVPFRIIYSSTVGISLPIRIIKMGSSVPCPIDWMNTEYGSSSAYFALVENTPEDTKKGLYKCYGFNGKLSDFEEYGGNDYNSKNNVATTIVQLFKINAGGDSGNYLMVDASGSGDLIIYDKNGVRLKTLITSTNKPRIHYALSLNDPSSNTTLNRNNITDMIRVNTGRMELSYMDPSLFVNGANSYKLASVTDWINDRRTNPNVIQGIYTQASNKIFVKMTNQQVMYSPMSQLKLYFDASGSLILDAGINTTNTTKDGVQYTKVPGNYNVYQYQLDNRSNKLFYANDYDKSIREIPIDLQKLSNTYAQPVPNLFPSLGKSYKVTDRTNSNDCQTQCNNDPNCEYFFRVTGIQDSKDKCVLSNGVLLEVAGSNPAYKTSSLTIRGKRINVVGDPNFEKLVYDSNGYAKKNDYKLQDQPLNADTKAGNIGDYDLNQIIQSAQTRFNGKESSIKVGANNNTTDMNTTGIQGFSLYRGGNNVHEGFDSVVDNAIQKIDRNKSKLDNYVKTQNKINKTSQEIRTVMTDLSTNWWIMKNSPVDKYDFSNNLYSGADANGGVSLYNLSRDTSKEKAIMDDLNTYMIEENNMNMIATLTLATLVIGAIFIAKGANST